MEKQPAKTQKIGNIRSPKARGGHVDNNGDQNRSKAGTSRESQAYNNANRENKRQRNSTGGTFEPQFQ